MKPLRVTDLPAQWENEGLLWQAFQEGDKRAFEYIYQQHIQQLINYGYKISSSRSLIQDSIQDLFVELWESRDRLANVTSIKYYLLKSLRYKMIRQRQNDMTETLDEAQLITEQTTAESQLMQAETTLSHSQQLAQALVQLPKRQREAIYLRYFQELSNEEVATVMGVNYQSACKFIYTALKTLRDQLQLSTLLPLLFTFFESLKIFLE